MLCNMRPLGAQAGSLAGRAGLRHKGASSWCSGAGLLDLCHVSRLQSTSTVPYAKHLVLDFGQTCVSCPTATPLHDWRAVGGWGTGAAAPRCRLTVSSVTPNFNLKTICSQCQVSLRSLEPAASTGNAGVGNELASRRARSQVPSCLPLQPATRKSSPTHNK